MAAGQAMVGGLSGGGLNLGSSLGAAYSPVAATHTAPSGLEINNYGVDAAELAARTKAQFEHWEQATVAGVQA